MGFGISALEIVLGRMDMLTILNLPVYENGVSFHLFRSFVSYSSTLYFSVYIFY